MKILTWNINGIRASRREKSLKVILDSLEADVICLISIAALLPLSGHFNTVLATFFVTVSRPVIGPEESHHPLDQSHSRLKRFSAPQAGAGIIGRSYYFPFL